MKYSTPLAIVIVCCASVQAQESALKQKMNARASLEKASVQLRNARNGGERKAIDDARVQLLVAERAYAQASQREFQARLSKVPKKQQAMYIYEQIPKLTERKQNFENVAVNAAAGLKDAAKTDQAYQSSVARNAAMSRMILIDEEVNQRYVRERRKTEDRHWSSHRKGNQKVDAKVARMEELLSRISSNNYNESYGKKGAAHEMTTSIKQAKYDRDYAEYRKLANQRWVDPRSGKELTSDLQKKARSNALRALEDSVKKQSFDGGVPETLVNLVTGDKKDSRLETARMLTSERTNDISRGYLDHLEGETSKPQDHFRAMSNSIHKKKGALEDWFANEYLPQANDGKDSVASQIFNLGMGTAKRSIMKDSEDGVNTVRRKIDATLANADEAAAALSYAAKNEPGVFSDFHGLSAKEVKVRKHQRDLLMNYGMLKADAKGKLHYVVPSETRKLNSVTSVDLPKSPWLDAVSVKSTAVTGLSMMTGSGAAALSHKIATVGNLSQKGAAALTVLTEVGASSAMDGLINVAEGKAANFDQALLQNLTMSGVGKLGKGLSDSFLGRNKAWREALEETGERSVRGELKDAFKGKDGLLRSKAMKRFIANSVGLTSEASIETLYQAAAQGGPLDRDAFMASLASGAMSKAAGSAMRQGGKKAKERFIKSLPEGLKQWAKDNPIAWVEAKERAIKSNAHGREALSRFESVKRSADDRGGLGLLKRRRSDAELIHDPHFADHVARSLAKGEMKWSDLGVLAEKKGSTMTPLLEAVKQRRTKWAYGVDEPDATSVRKRATETLNAEFAKDIEKVRRSGGTADEKAAQIKKLRSTHLQTLDQLGAINRKDTPEGRAAKKLLKKASGQLFNEAVMKDGVGKEVKELAAKKLKREFQYERESLLANPDRLSSDEVKRRVAALDANEKKQLQSIREAKMIAPGSGDPTSDIDRSWSNPRVVQATKRLQRDRMMLDENGVKGIGSTTAKAWDLNEYYNVMDGVSAAMPLRNDKEKGFANEKVNYKGVGNVSHDDVVAGNSRAAAMAHMDAEHQAQYKQNALREAHGDPAKVEQVKREFDIAKIELENSKARLDAERKKVGDAFGIDPNSKEAEIYARDKIYGESMREVKALDMEIAGLKEGSPQWKKKQALRERLMNRASRDGIEAYTDAAGLDIIVNRMQQKEDKHGNKLSVDALMRDPNFTRDGDLKQFSKRQLDNMMNDQVMMISEHLNAFQDGKETTFQTARALAKYTQRSALVAKMNGVDLPDGHPMKELYKKASLLVEHKGDPAKMMEALKELAGPGGSARDGLRKLVEMTEMGIPGLKDYTKVKSPKSADLNAPKGFSSLNSYKNWLRERDRLYEEGGDVAVNRWLDDQAEAIQIHREALLKEKDELEELDSKYLPENQKKARRLEEELEALEKLLLNLPRSLHEHELYKKLADRKAAIQYELDKMKKAKEADTKRNGKAKRHPDLEAIDKELDHLNDVSDMLGEAKEKGSRPPKRDEVDSMFEDEEEMVDEKKKGGGGIVPALEDAFKELGK